LRATVTSNKNSAGPPLLAEWGGITTEEIKMAKEQMSTKLNRAVSCRMMVSNKRAPEAKTGMLIGKRV